MDVKSRGDAVRMLAAGFGLAGAERVYELLISPLVEQAAEQSEATAALVERYEADLSALRGQVERAKRVGYRDAPINPCRVDIEHGPHYWRHWPDQEEFRCLGDAS